MKQKHIELIITEMKEVSEQMKALSAEMDKYGTMQPEFELYGQQWRDLKNELLNDLQGIGGIKILLHLLDNYAPPPPASPAG